MATDTIGLTRNNEKENLVLTRLLVLNVQERDTWDPFHKGVSTLTLILLQNKNLPPGPWGFPFIGAVHQIGYEGHKESARLRKKYGDVFSLWLSSE